MIQKNNKLQLLIGMTGTALVFLLWKIAGLFLYKAISPAALQILNVAAILSLSVPPLLVLKLSGEPLSSLGFSRSKLPQQIAVGIVIGLGMAVVLALIPTLLGIDYGAGFESIGEAIWKLLYFVFVVGLTEEFVFRGFLYEKLNDICISDEMPVLLSSALFGLFHLSGFNLMQVLNASLIGAFFCICKKKIPCCSILSLAIAHGIHDWMIRLLASLL